jgi:hypothetical protein
MIRLRPGGYGVTGRIDERVVAFGGEGTAGFQTCCIADVPIGGAWKSGARLCGGRHAGLETRDTAGLETCGTTMGKAIALSRGQCQDAPKEKVLKSNQLPSNSSKTGRHLIFRRFLIALTNLLSSSFLIMPRRLTPLDAFKVPPQTNQAWPVSSEQKFCDAPDTGRGAQSRPGVWRCHNLCAPQSHTRETGHATPACAGRA